ncbi:MAG TPA: transglutaminase-like domain-containing protein [Bacteroidota bacterium]|nr:transglutaminase-like domain-containing protein [Bacteroidota bacterium]
MTSRWLFLSFLLFQLSFSQSDLLQQVNSLELQGKFKEAELLLQKALADGTIGSGERKQLAFEFDRLDRIRKDYPLSKERLFKILSESVKELTQQEFDRWIAEGRFDSRTIDGTLFFMGSSRSNLFFRYPELSARRIHAPDDTEFERSTLHAVETIAAEARRRATPFVLPRTFRNTMTVTLKADAVPPRENVRAWLPIPRSFPHQKNFRVISSSSPIKNLDSEASPIRSVYLEQKTEEGKPTVFSVEYEYTGYGVFFDVKPESVKAYHRNDTEYVRYTKEGPHVVFTDRIKTLSAQLAGGEPNPFVRAKRFYDWISETIKYSYALEYSTIRNISEYCAQMGYGDCGQAALLFITLCRYNGIPARWQSGWLTIPGGKTIHDWTEIYLSPYGWIPADPYMGVFAMQYFKGSEERRKKIRDFYFGGLDQYRMAANSDHNQALNPPKRSFRSDNVDFQRGELEYGETNIYFDKYSFKLDVQEVKSN